MVFALLNLSARRQRRTHGRASRRSCQRIETLEDRLFLTAVTLTDHEQLLLELTNRAREDPWAEVARNPFVSDLNEGLAAGTISGAAKQPLAPVQALINAAGLHSQDMLDNDYFAHVNLQGQSPTDRAAAQGYPSPIGENLAWNGSTGPIDQTQALMAAHNGLFDSPSHRSNMLYSAYAEGGMGVRFGPFTSGITYNAIMATENFGFQTYGPHITGVAYHDTVINDDFYSIGEGEAGLRITALNTTTGMSHFTTSGPSGGYSLAVPAGTYTVTAVGDSLDAPIVITNVSIGNLNVKVDFESSATPADGDDIAGLTSNEFWVGQLSGANWTTTHFGSWPQASTFSDVATADVNGDGLDDIVGRDTGGAWWVALSTGQGTFMPKVWGRWVGTTSWTDVHVGDFNGDGFDDIVGRAGDGTFWVAKSTGNSFVNEYWGSWVNISWQDVVVGDFNGDDRDDIAGRASTDGTWWVAGSLGNRFANSYYGRWSTTVDWRDVNVGDFNGDGLDDIAGRTNGDWWINRSSGSGFFFVEHWGAWYVGVTWQNALVGDFDNDGDDDIVGRANGVWWISRSTGANFVNETMVVFWDPNINWQHIKVADINGDGKDDVVGRVNGQWWTARSNAVGRFSSLYLGRWSSNAIWTDVVIGNFT